ncbi:MAG: DNA polymerase IV [Verrucomicrobia bacterium]|nr:DNA polymerase IV [Verrucomicrobiota bacterium]MBU4291890.1 DNA polymerase IV [Verrucomicrobiota bacterium]MBU4429809.1 DNA polymerase IV [Verrucomicrobiota bacterium]MCG2680284.1 DNA polymerase IV [Kiritimatiellia bacterium]
MLTSFPTAILHVDGDAFFASVEQAVQPALKGKPVVTGKERGIIACASYEAKALGIQRGIPLHEARAAHPQLVILPSDYETYSLFSRRMFTIMRRYSPLVEEYSIDEGFAELSGLRRLFRASYEEIARRLQNTIREELDITVSVGLSLTKSLAKLASKYRKPAGFTAVRGRHIHLFIQRTPLDKVWGFGPNTVHLLSKHGLKTAYDFAVRPEAWAQRLLGKIGRELWNELRGHPAYPINPDPKTSQASISKCKTFTSPSADRNFVYAALIRNLESAFIKLRRHRLKTVLLTVILRRRDFSDGGLEARLNRATASTQEAVPLTRTLFDRLFREGLDYRATAVILGRLEEDRLEQPDLFEDRLRIDAMTRAASTVDAINARFGKHTVSLGPALFLHRPKITGRDEHPWRKTALFKGETARRRLYLPRLRMGDLGERPAEHMAFCTRGSE